MNRKGVSPVVATILLVAIAVASVSSYWVWFRSFQSQIQEEVEQQSDISASLRLNILDINDDGTKYYVTLQNASSREALEFLGIQDFIIDGQNNWDKIEPSFPITVNPNSSIIFILTPPSNKIPVQGRTYSFVFIGHSSKGQVVATTSYRP